MQSKSYRRERGQQGYVMMALLLAVALVLIALSAGLPAISAELRRRREEELIHRGVQYTRAIEKYYRKYGHYPISLDQLEDTNHVRFLRKRYKDPMSDSDFRLLHVGEVQLSFAPAPAAPGPGTASRTAGSAADSSNSVSNNGLSSPFVSLAKMGATGPALGGGPIMGVASTSEKQSFRVFNDKDHYNDWQFVYAPALDRGVLFTHPFDGLHDLAPGPGAMPRAPQAQSPTYLNTPGTVRP